MFHVEHYCFGPRKVVSTYSVKQERAVWVQSFQRATPARLCRPHRGLPTTTSLTCPAGIHPAGHPRCTPEHPHPSCTDRLKSRQSLLPRTRTFPQLMFPSLHRYSACGSPRVVAPTGPRVPWAQSPDRRHQHHSQRGGGMKRQLIIEADIANKDLQ